MENWFKSVWLLNLSLFFFFLGISILTPVVSPFLVSLRAEPFLVGIITGVTSGLSLLSKPIGGAVGDRGYRFHALVAGNLLGALAGALYAISAISGNIYLFAIGRAIHGFSMGFFFPPSLSTAVDLAPPGRVGETLGWRGMMFSLGNIIGPVFGGYLSDALGFPTAFSFTAVFSLLGALFAFEAWREAGGSIGMSGGLREEGTSYKALLTATFIGVSLALFFFSVSYSGVTTFLPAYYKVLRLPQRVFGYYMMVLGTFSLATRVAGGKGTDRWGPLPVATTGMLIVIGGYVSLYLYPLPLRSYLSAAIIGTGFGLSVPAMQVMAIGKLPQRIRTMGSGVYTMFLDLGTLAGQVSLGYVAQLRGYAGVFPLLPAIAVVALLTLYLPRLVGGGGNG
ncbi:MFS transporter [Thermococcus sp.]